MDDLKDREWGWHESQPMVILNDGGDVVARVEGTEQRFARLIAAAPALLAGLDEALGLMYDANPSACDESPDYQRLCALTSNLRGIPPKETNG